MPKSETGSTLLPSAEQARAYPDLLHLVGDTLLADVIAGIVPLAEEQWGHNIDTTIIDRLEYRHRADVIALGWASPDEKA